MKSIIEKLIQSRNPNFSFDNAVSGRMLLSLFSQYGISYLRGLKLLFTGRYSKKLLLGKHVKFFNIKNIEIGRWVKIGDYCYLSGLGKKKLKLGNNVSIGAFSRIIISTSFNNIGSHIYIGDNVGIGEFAYLGGAGGLEIGNDCIVGQYFSCHPENHIYHNPEILIRHQGVTRSGIRIGNNCWIGSKVTICDGVEIGDNCVIAAGAVITKSMPTGSVIGGVPAKVIKSTTNL